MATPIGIKRRHDWADVKVGNYDDGNGEGGVDVEARWCQRCGALDRGEDAERWSRFLAPGLLGVRASQVETDCQEEG